MRIPAQRLNKARNIMRNTLIVAALTAAIGCSNRPATDPALTESIGFYTGVSGVVDKDSAHALLLTAAEDNDPLSVMWIARVHSTGRMGFPNNYEYAQSVANDVIGQVEFLAGMGDAEAEFLMGTAFAEGLGKPIDPVEAIVWYRRAAAQHNVLALHNLGNVHRDGTGVEQNDSLAIYWWLQAATIGDAIPALRLGEFYEGGRGTEADMVKAREWYETSANKGNLEAQAALERLGPEN
jgi:TPR repeat protein